MCKRILIWCAVALIVFAVAVFRNPPPDRRPTARDDLACQSRVNQSSTVEAHVRAGAQFDIIVFAAAGFVGSQVSLYLATAPGNFKFAIAGRSFNDLHDLDKLIADTVRDVGHGREADAMFLAEAQEREDMQKIARKAKVILSTIDPYTKYGSTLVQVCAEEGTHYADLSRGEFTWQRQMIDGSHRRAKRSGAKIVFAAGFHALPFDLGATLALEALDRTVAKAGIDLAKSPVNAAVTAVVTSMRGAMCSGGMQAFRYAMDLPQIVAPEDDPYFLVPNASCPVDSVTSGWGRSRYHSALKVVGIPHAMGLMNSRVVRRSLDLLGRRSVSYGESVSLVGMVSAFVFGPWRKTRPSFGGRSGGYSLRFLAVDETSGHSVSVNMEGRGDPDYGHSSKLLAEVGLCLSIARCHRAGVGGGVLTAASATDTAALLARLRAAKHEDADKSYPLLEVDIVEGHTARVSGDEL